MVLYRKSEAGPHFFGICLRQIHKYMPSMV